MKQVQEDKLDILQKATIEGKEINLHDTDYNAEVGAIWSSAFSQNDNLLARGEYKNPNSKSRKALITFTDLKTGKLKGNILNKLKNNLSIF